MRAVVTAPASVLSYLRQAPSTEDLLLIVCNFTPVVRQNYRVGTPRSGYWREIHNSDAHDYGGSGHGNLGCVEAAPIPYHGRSHSLTLTLPPLAILVFKSEGRRA